MRTLFFLPLACSLGLAIGCSEAPAEGSTQEPASASIAPDNVHEGLLSYDGAYAKLTACDRNAVLLSGDLMNGLLEEIRRFKADPAYTVWVKVETEGEGTRVPDQGYPIYTAGKMVSATPGDPCDRQPHVK